MLLAFIFVKLLTVTALDKLQSIDPILSFIHKSLPSIITFDPVKL